MIEILDENFKKIDILRKYTFSQYNDKIRDIGTFEIDARIANENMFLLDDKKEYYVLFNGKYIYKIENIAKDSDSEYEKTMKLTGRSCLLLFTKRVIAGTIVFKGNTAQYIKTLIESEITKDETNNRYVNIEVQYDDEEYLNSICSSVDKQVTGGYIWDEMQAVCEQDKLSLDFYPVVETLHNYNGSETNISKWVLVISGGKNKTKTNTQGNAPVIFSQSLSNIARTEYEFDTKEYCNVAYVAGEGEGTERKWYEIYDNEESQNKKGWQRNELWVDARDIQSETQDGETITESEYEILIQQRANENFSENTKSKTYTSTIAEANKQYKYGVDYSRGDFVTIIDNELKISIDAQITNVIYSVQNSREIIDIEFTYGKIERNPIEQIKSNNVLLKKTQNDVKYIENMLKGSNQSEFVKNLYLSMHPVGDLVLNTTGVNPGTIFGGTWVAWGSGRVPVGVNASDTNFNTVEKTGGASNVTLTSSQCGVPTHSHGLNSHTHSLTSNSTGGVMLYNNPSGQMGRYQLATSDSSDKYAFTASGTEYLIYGGANTGAASGNTANNTAADASSAHTNLQPYITCYMWKRTA